MLLLPMQRGGHWLPPVGVRLSSLRAWRSSAAVQAIPQPTTAAHRTAVAMAVIRWMLADMDTANAQGALLLGVQTAASPESALPPSVAASAAWSGWQAVRGSAQAAGRDGAVGQACVGQGSRLLYLYPPTDE